MYSNKLICNILIYINENINSKITIEELQKRFFYNKFYIVKLFNQEIHMTIIQYVNSIRIYNAIFQMKSTNYSLTKIAIKNGFSSLEYFSETFKQITKVSPKIFKNYFDGKKYLSNKNIDLINEAIIKLHDIANIKNNYLSRKKPESPSIKKLSIFKNR